MKKILLLLLASITVGIKSMNEPMEIGNSTEENEETEICQSYWSRMEGSLLCKNQPNDKLLYLIKNFEKIRDNERILKEIINGGCNLKQRDAVGRTFLHYAVVIGNNDLVRILIDYGALTKRTR